MSDASNKGASQFVRAKKAAIEFYHWYHLMALFFLAKTFLSSSSSMNFNTGR
jgi:hypothetical protein